MTIVIAACLWLLTFSMDTCLFFLLIRLILTHGEIRWLRPLDEIGRPLVNPLLNTTRRWGVTGPDRFFTEKGQVILLLAVLSFARLLFGALGQLVCRL